LANQGIAVTLHESLADVQASEPSFCQALAGPRVTAILAGQPVVAVYEVAARVAQVGRAANT
jgi:hypothetical protein